MGAFARGLLIAGGLVAAAAALAQQELPPNGLFLVAKPQLADPNFRQTVVLVTQAPDYSTFGVIINRPTRLGLRRFLPEDFPATHYRDAVYFGGPVMPQALVAAFRSDATPAAPAFHVLQGLYLSMHPDNVKALITDRKRHYRLYAGFSGWAPRQLESEFARADWYVLPADAEILFRRNTEGLWQELVRKAEVRPVRQ